MPESGSLRIRVHVHERLGWTLQLVRTEGMKGAWSSGAGLEIAGTGWDTGAGATTAGADRPCQSNWSRRREGVEASKVLNMRPLRKQSKEKKKNVARGHAVHGYLEKEGPVWYKDV